MEAHPSLPRASKSYDWKTTLFKLTEAVERTYSLIDKHNVDDDTLRDITACLIGETPGSQQALLLVQDFGKDAFRTVQLLLLDDVQVRTELYRLWRRPENSMHVRVLLHVFGATSPALVDRFNALFCGKKDPARLVATLTDEQRRKYEHIRRATWTARHSGHTKYNDDLLKEKKAALRDASSRDGGLYAPIPLSAFNVAHLHAQLDRPRASSAPELGRQHPDYPHGLDAPKGQSESSSS